MSKYVCVGSEVVAQAACVSCNCIHMRAQRIKQIASEEEKLQQLQQQAANGSECP
jgi:hypothetical protein